MVCCYWRIINDGVVLVDKIDYFRKQRILKYFITLIVQQYASDYKVQMLIYEKMASYFLKINLFNVVESVLK